MKNKIGLIIFAAMVFGAVAAMIAHAGGPMQGPVIATHADVTCPSGSSTVAVPESTPTPGNTGPPNRYCVEADWVSGNAARLGDSNIGAARGILLEAVSGASQTICAPAAIYCFGVGGTSVVSFTEINRQ
jgi:hypothetical protein